MKNHILVIGSALFISISLLGGLAFGGVYTEYDVLGPDVWPTAITSGPDGALWFSD